MGKGHQIITNRKIALLSIFVLIITTVIGGFFAIQAARAPIILQAQLTETAEEKSTELALPTITPTSTITPSNTPSPTMTAVPSATPPVIDAMDSRSGWHTLICDPKCAGSNGPSLITISLIQGRTDSNSDNAVEISYTVKPEGWVEIERDIQPSSISGIPGIRFYAKNSSVPYSPNLPNTIEVKLMLNYPGDEKETAFGMLTYGATDIDRKWVPIEAPFSDFKCMFPEENCLKHPKLVLDYALRLSFAISNKPDFNDKAGPGIIAFDDVREIQP